MKNYLFTSESVSGGHPDKVADQISDAVLDWHLSYDPDSRVACETMVAKNIVIVAGEITSTGKADYPTLAKKVIEDIGYGEESGFDPDKCNVLLSLSNQSPDIAVGVDRKESMGAGDQGLMFGFAVNETEELMPLPISLSHRLLKRLAELRKHKIVDWLRPDSKSQVTVKYENNFPVSVEKVILSTQHSESVSINELRDFVISEVIEKVIPENLISRNINYFINPTGRFVEGGPMADTGLTGRKIIVDTYGGSCPHGGGAFSGKDPTKVDRSAAYMARYVAKNIVASGITGKCTVQLSYAIGVAEPTSVYLDFHGTGIVEEDPVMKKISDIFDLTPQGIIKKLDLKKPIYRMTSSYGHFGRSIFPWEKTDSAELLRSEFIGK